MKYILFLFTILFSISSQAQKHKSKVPDFDMADFMDKEKVAYWLNEYDYVAWHTSDSVSASSKEERSRLGREWFCYEDADHTWHAVYGKYNGNDFDMVFHYHLDTNYRIYRVYDKVDTSLLNTYSRALNTANKMLTALRDTVHLDFNQYIRKNPDNTLTVWILPSFQPNSTAVFGGEFIYTIDASGSKILKDDSYFQGRFRGFKVGEPREIWLNYTELDKPTLGTVFFVVYYGKYFTSIYIDNKNSSSTRFKDENGHYTWIHTTKGQSKK